MITSAIAVTKTHCKIGASVTIIGFAIALLIAYDRRPPIELLAGEIVPAEAAPGQQVIARWRVDWMRSCEADTFREIIGSDGVIKPYTKYKSRLPYRLGEQSPDHDVILPMGLPEGRAVYRLAFQFADCGITSRIVPLRVEAPELQFTIVPKKSMPP